MKILAKCYGGSRMYGLDTPESDVDIRYVFLNDSIDYILGLKKHEHETKQDDTEDSQGFELRRFFQLLQKGNTQALELLHNTNWLEIDSEFQKLVLDQKDKFIDTKQIFKCLCGYMQGERSLVFGRSTGKLGTKRKEAVDKYGYSFKNAVQFIRLALTGYYLFSYNYYPVNWRNKLILNIPLNIKFDYYLLYDIKTKPVSFSKEEIETTLNKYELLMKTAFNEREESQDKVFCEKYANDVILAMYFPKIINEMLPLDKKNNIL